LRRVIRVRNVLLLALVAVGGLCVMDQIVFPLPEHALHRPHSTFVYSREGKLLACFASADEFWRKPVKLDEVSPRLVKTVLNTEDRWFYWHPGVNPVSLVTAAIDNIRAGKVVRGGSTITMQIARMMEPKPRTILSKFIEILRAFQLEWHYSKDELLEFYLNLAPYGGNIEGVGAASFFYFGKSANELTLAESATLAAIPASPNSYRPDLQPEACRRRRDRNIAALRDRGLITAEEYADAIAEEIPDQRMERPFIAPHFSTDLRANFADSCDLYSTIDYNVQLLCERLAKRHHDFLTSKEIQNLSVVVIDNRSGELLAMVGSPDFHDEHHDGQVNGATSLRSPGSALKPFAYALGFEDGLIVPASRVEDIPVNYAGYSPENYDEQYHGLVSVREALINSYNVPAVNVTARLGLRKFYDLLKRGGLSSLDKRYYEYGLPLVLGACEVSLLDLSNLYAMLARGGLYQPVSMLITGDTQPSDSLFSYETCFLTSSILSNLQRPELTTSWEFSADRPTIAWKTGTSYGRKDAWTIGYNPKYTVGVWAGNFSGEGSPYIVGVDIAAPLMLDIFQEITRGEELTWFEPSPDVEVREFCARSGLLPGPHCPKKVRDLYVRGVSPGRRCDVHRIVKVDAESGYAVCSACRRSGQVISQVTEKWPPKISRWLLACGQTSPPPVHNPNCTGVPDNRSPVISSPEEDGQYVLSGGTPEQYQQIKFEASVAADSREVHWFLDREWFATSEAGSSLFYAPEPGEHKLMCVDDLGRSSTVSFVVKRVESVTR
jgi:penicillin-binding protein 1C